MKVESIIQMASLGHVLIVATNGTQIYVELGNIFDIFIIKQYIFIR